MKLKLILAALVLTIAASTPSAQLAPPNANGITYGHIHLNVRDIEVHKKFWAQYFGGLPMRYRACCRLTEATSPLSCRTIGLGR